MDLPTLLVLGVWAAFAASVILRLRRRGAQTFDDTFTTNDRRLVGASVFYLLVPAAVLASQLLQVGALYAAGGDVAGFETWVYWGNVELAAALSPARAAAVASVPPLGLLLATFGLVAWTARRPGRAAHNFLRLEAARVLGTLALGVQPVVSILARRGDHHALRQALNAWREPWGEAALLAYACVAAYAVFRWRNAHRLRALATPLHDAARDALARLEEDENDADAARLLGAARLASDHPLAIAAIERAAALAPEDPRVELLRGQARLRTGEPRSASLHLCRAGQLLEAHEGEAPALLFEIELALSAARIALGDAEGAVLTAEAARETKPSDPRGLLVLVDALVAMGRTHEACRKLEGAHGSAEGAAKREIERRLGALRRFRGG